MRMVGVLEHLQLLLHQLLIHIILLELVLDDCFDSAWDPCSSMSSHFNHSKCSSSQLLSKFVVFTKLVNLLEFGELFYR